MDVTESKSNINKTLRAIQDQEKKIGRKNKAGKTLLITAPIAAATGAGLYGYGMHKNRKSKKSKE